MYENISGILDMNAEQRFKIAIVGEPKVGKSWLAMTAPGTIYEADFDDRSESIKSFVQKYGKTNITAKTYVDRNPAFPIAVSQFEADIAMFEYLKQQGKEIPEWYVLDSMTFLRAACEHELIKQHPTMSREIKLGANKIKIPQGWDIVNGNKEYLAYIVGRLSELGNVIAVFHELDETDKQRSTKDQKAYTGRKTIQPQYLSSLLSIFNDIFRVTIEYDGTRTVQVQPSSEFVASTSMKLGLTEKPNLADMIAKHKSKVAI
jgi:hypothetical protein